MYGMAPEVISSSLSPRKLLSGEITAKFSEVQRLAVLYYFFVEGMLIVTVFIVSAVASEHVFLIPQ